MFTEESIGQTADVSIFVVIFVKKRNGDPIIYNILAGNFEFIFSNICQLLVFVLNILFLFHNVEEKIDSFEFPHCCSDICCFLFVFYWQKTEQQKVVVGEHQRQTHHCKRIIIITTISFSFKNCLIGVYGSTSPFFVFACIN